MEGTSRELITESIANTNEPPDWEGFIRNRSWEGWLLICVTISGGELVQV
jgi:hypothetical protein